MLISEAEEKLCPIQPSAGDGLCKADKCMMWHSFTHFEDEVEGEGECGLAPKTINVYALNDPARTT